MYQEEGRSPNMKWGKNKAVASSSTASRPFLISHVIPASWLTKFKQMSVSPGHRHATKAKPKGTKPALNLNSNSAAAQFTSPNRTPGGRFYSAHDDEAYWRLSFGDEGEGGEEYYISDEEVRFPPSSCRSCCTRSNKVGAAKSFTLPLEIGNFPAIDTREREKMVEIRTPRLRSAKERDEKKKGRRSKQRGFGSGAEKVEMDWGKAEFKVPASETIDPFMQMDENIIAQNCQEESLQLPADNSPVECEKMEDMRKSLYIRTESVQRKRSKKQGGKGRAHHHSPRTPAKSDICKIRAIEDMKRSALKTKRNAKPEGFDGMKSFAVVKSSYDPQNDFRDSMMEMIQEMRIRKTEELEELLACYLMLNSEEYHELIINVFRQVWFDLNHAGLSWS